MKTNNYQPSASNARTTLGVKLDERGYPAGPQGAALSLNEVARRVREGRNDPLVRGWAGKVLIAAGKPKSNIDQAQAILDAVRKQTMYAQDPVGTEMNVAAKHTLCLDDKLCMPLGDCFPKGTILLRDDFEFINVEDIKVGDRIWGYDKWTTVEATSFKGTLPLDVIVTSNGSDVQLTSSHKVYIKRCPKHYKNVCPCMCIEGREIVRVNVSDLKEKDVLLNPERISFGTEYLDPDRALIEGYYVSDGWHQPGRFSISGQDGCPKEEQKREVENICNSLGIYTKWYRKSICINDPEWALRCEQMGCYAPVKHFLSINLQEAAAAASLKGVMADSGKNTNGDGRTYTTTSFKLMLQTRVLHKMFGYSCGKRYIEDHGGLGENPIWRLGVRVKDSKFKKEKFLRVKEVIKNVREAPCYDIQTSDHYVYLPEHDLTVSNCDDLVVATASAIMSVGIPTQVVGQSFQGKTDAPTHVLLAIDSPDGWKKVDPSSPTMKVGEFFPGTKEWWVDPMEVNGFSLAATANAKDGENGGDFVGVGAPDVGLGDIDRGAVYDAITSQLQDALFTLEGAVNGLGASLVKIQQTRAQLQPGQPFDPDPFTISSVADFPNNGIWTQSMQEISIQLWQVGNTLVQAGHDALNGGRQIIVDQATNEVYIASATSDEWSLKLLAQKATDSIFGFLNKAGTIISGFSAKTGQDYTPAQVQTEITALNQVGVAVAPIVVIGAVAVAAIAGVTVYYVISKLCQTAKTISDNAVRKSVVDTVASGKITANQGTALLDAISANIKASADAEAKTNESDPFTKGLGSIGTIVTWTVIGGVAFAGLYVTMPLLKELGQSAAAAHRLKRIPAT